MGEELMRAAVLHGSGDIRVEDRPVPKPEAGEVLIAVAAAGICGSDAASYSSVQPWIPLDHENPVTRHRGPLILGHEFVGEIVAAGADVAGSRVGALTVCGAGISCGRCRRCREGRTNLCDDYATLGLQRDGGLAEFVAAPAEICIDVDHLGLRPDTAALAQPMSIAVHAVRRGRVATGERVVVIGAGGIGAFAAFLAVERGAEVTVVDLDPDRLELAAGLGVARTIQAGDPGAFEPDFTADVVLEVTGSSAGLATAAALVGHGTRIVIVGIHKEPREVDLTAVALHEAELIGTLAHVCAEDLAEAVEMLARAPQRWSELAPEVLTLEELVPEGLEPMLEGTAKRVKTLIDPAAGTARAARHGPSA
jgi:(R,R)-butanediol dehydrogenase / meso-butanediol dehydrogenase / diacetyl reductase